MFFLYTDGLIEQNKGREMYGEERLQNLLAQSNISTLDDIIENVAFDFNDFRGNTPMQDDVTYMLIQSDHDQL